MSSRSTHADLTEAAGRDLDAISGMRPLPQKPEPQPDPPYIPRKIGEF